MEVYETLPIVPLRDVVVFPHMMMPFVIGRPSSIRALEHARACEKAAEQHTRAPALEPPARSEAPKVGRRDTAGRVRQ